MDHNIERAISDTSAALAMVVTVPVYLHISLATTYGDYEPGGYTERFIKGASGIHTCYHDNRLCDAFVAQTGSGGDAMLSSTELFAKVVALQKNTEELMMSGAGVGAEPGTMTLSDGEEMLIKDCVKAASPPKKKKGKSNSALDGSPSASARRRAAAAWDKMLQPFLIH